MALPFCFFLPLGRHKQSKATRNREQKDATVSEGKSPVLHDIRSRKCQNVRGNVATRTNSDQESCYAVEDVLRKDLWGNHQNFMIQQVEEQWSCDFFSPCKEVLVYVGEGLLENTSRAVR